MDTMSITAFLRRITPSSITSACPISAGTAAADRFDEAVKNDSERASWAVRTIGQLYGIEKEIREHTPPLSEGEIVEKRMTQALPILTQLHEWMQQKYPKVLLQSPIGKA